MDQVIILITMLISLMHNFTGVHGKINPACTKLFIFIFQFKKYVYVYINIQLYLVETLGFFVERFVCLYWCI